MSLYYLSVSLHLLAALLWLGGMFFLAVVGAPVLRSVEPVSLRRELFTRIGVQFRLVGWIAIGVLLVTGVGNLYFRGLVTSGLLTRAEFWTGAYGKALAVKLAAMTLMLFVQAAHDFVFGPRAGQLDPAAPEWRRTRRAAAWLGRLNALVAIVLVLAAVRLARGG